MSAWMTSDTHRNLIVKAHVERCANPVDTDVVARDLFVENRRSLWDRYRDELPTDEEVAAVTYTDPAPGRTVSDAGAQCLAACYDYQSCEHDEWRDSDVCKAVINPLEALGELAHPGDRDALPWGADESNVDAFLEPVT
jgi:hypothetical protein